MATGISYLIWVPLDREFIDCDGMPAGRVDDLELSDPGPGEPPVLTALLCGPTAFGPRLGGRLGTWWQAIGRRLRPVADSYPNRIDPELIDHVDRLEIFAGLLTILAWLLLRHEQDPLQDLSRPGPDDQDPPGTKPVPASQEDRRQGSHGGIRGRPPTPFGI